MDGIYEWLRSVAVFFLLMTAVLNVLPQAKDRKYIQFFLGLVMLAVLFRPVLALGKLDGKLEDVLDQLTLEEEAEELRNSQIRIDGLQQEVLYQAYEKEIEDQIGTFLEGQGMEPVRTEVSIGEDGENGLQVRRIEVTAKVSAPEGGNSEGQTGNGGTEGSGTGGKERELKKELAQVYQVSEAHIIVKLQE